MGGMPAFRLSGKDGGRALDEACFKGYTVDDSLYLREYAKVFAWGMIKAEDMDTIRTYYSFLSFVNEGEGSTRMQYLERYGLTDAAIRRLPQLPARLPRLIAPRAFILADE